MAFPNVPVRRPQTAPPPAAGAEPAPAGFDSRDLMLGRREILIRHAGQTYRLRHTRNDKLILVK